MKQVGKLTITTPSDCELSMTRVFNAPRHLVWEAYTKPELVKRWLGAMGGWTMPVCEIDVRVGGKFRYLWKSSEGHTMGMSGVYLEILPNERIVNTEKFDEAWYEGEARETVVLTEKDGKTTLVSTVRYGSKEIRDMVLASPMESGVAASYDALEVLLAK